MFLLLLFAAKRRFVGHFAAVCKFAEPFNLWECQLAILHCAGHPDSMLIETVWNNIIEGEIAKTAELSAKDRINIMANKIVNLGKLYSSSQKYFPLGML